MATKDFAKLFNSACGQIVVLQNQNTDGEPAITFMFDPGVDGLAVCHISIGFTDDETGEEKARKAFVATGQEDAERVVLEQIKKIQEIWGKSC